MEAAARFRTDDSQTPFHSALKGQAGHSAVGRCPGGFVALVLMQPDRIAFHWTQPHELCPYERQVERVESVRASDS